MRLTADWDRSLHEFRQREFDGIFGDCAPGSLGRVLELGAGDGFQSRLLAPLAAHLHCLDWDRARLESSAQPAGIRIVGDAERLTEYFEPGSFDLVYSSNLLEHLPDLDAALAGTHAILAEGGTTIHVVPNRLWKLAHLVLHLPARLVRAVEFALDAETRAKLRRRHSSARNNPKTERKRRPFLVRQLIPVPHGVASDNFEEWQRFGRRSWVRALEARGFEVVHIGRGPVTSPYLFGLRPLARLLERCGFCSEWVLVAVKHAVSPANEDRPTRA